MSTARLLQKIPLVHGLERFDDLTGIAGDRALRSRADRGYPARKAEGDLGIADVVYTSAGILYPDAQAALVFHIRAENDGTRASPWDSAWFSRAKLNGTAPLPPDPWRRQVFERYALPAPEYREYLVQYVASCFRHPHDYVCAHRHTFSDPTGVLCDNPRSRHFEVRIPRRLAADASTLQAVFLLQRRPPLSLILTRWLRALNSERVAVEYVSGSANILATKVRQWILDNLGRNHEHSSPR